MLTKNCNHHNHEGDRTLPITDFHKNKSTPDGVHYTCKTCSRRNARQTRAKKALDPVWRKRFNDSNTKYRQAGGKVLQMFTAAQERARKKNLEFDITKDDIEIPDTCPVLGITIKSGIGRPGENKLVSGAIDSSPSLDRIDNSKGYIKGNVRVISWRANYLKNTATLDEMIKLGEDANQQKLLLEEQ